MTTKAQPKIAPIESHGSFSSSWTAFSFSRSPEVLVPWTAALRGRSEDSIRASLRRRYSGLCPCNRRPASRIRLFRVAPELTSRQVGAEGLLHPILDQHKYILRERLGHLVFGVQPAW